MAAERIIDLFAGAGGWDEGLRMLGLWSLGIELDPLACATACNSAIRARSKRHSGSTPDATGPKGSAYLSTCTAPRIHCPGRSGTLA